ncbi:MAG: M20/M25/M40 family metallo-hydrolase [Candidatus Cryptobacteroides sp.]
MDIQLFMDMLNMDSTTGKEGRFAEFLAGRLVTGGCRLERFPVESMAGDVPEGFPLPENLLLSWGEPKVVFCTHLDTVPPYIPTVTESDVFRGRGTCDAKGQIFSMYEACRRLSEEGYDGFGLLLLAGEETGSFGAKEFRNVHPGSEWVIVGEPTDNCMASASKGTKSFELTFSGVAAHSGYPERGESAVMMFNDFVNVLRSVEFPEDEILGPTTWNIGRLESANPQNILSDRLTCRLYFRTTFASDEMVCNFMKNIAGENARLRFGRNKAADGSDLVGKQAAPWQKSLAVKAFGGDTPTRYDVLDGFPTKPVAFGSDAPQLTNFAHRILCGPGSILVAHTPHENITLSALQTATQNYMAIYKTIVSQKPHKPHDYR